MDPLSALAIVGFVVASIPTAISLNLLVAKILTRGSKGLCVVSEDEHAQVDIVFVHGLGGDPHETWCTRDTTKKVNWMTDLLPEDIRSTTPSRILTFGYSQRLFSIPSYGFLGKRTRPSILDNKVIKYLPQALYLHSKGLMEELTILRGEYARDRPIIFVAHNLGGLIVKSTLVQASADVGEYSRHKAIQLSTTGVLFFGTPQRETSRKSWSKLLTRIFTVSLELPAISLGESITAQAELFDLQVQRYKSIEMNFQNYAFYEKYMTQKEPSVKLYVVPEESVLPTNARPWWHKIRLDRNHQNMVKFERDDEDYQIVLGCIKTN
ncbi:uncharacterized protein LY89DRAFT_16754 [Mollisia scopiformis]|uniref:Uncharacterized protein n=1 Tax=Mollisia scopiformis TaxID=149040 RepID=A0A194XWY1_MOLSC|nr:uncharacterized protein LY89DRAFT_16754 [Mollisia scopiformis]KUJ24267.1 hypothetical protein LY89DRAFT_16754 [Mollisia scopiformis]